MKTNRKLSHPRTRAGRRVIDLFMCLAIVAFAMHPCPHMLRAQAVDGTLQIPSLGFLEWPLKAIEDTQESVVQGGLLQIAMERSKGATARERAQLLDTYVAENPNSPWTPSLRLGLGKHWLYAGGYTKALEHWGLAWESTKLYEAGQGKEVADYALAHFTRLLAVMGRLDELAAVMNEAGQRQLDGGPLTQKYLNTLDMYWAMRRRPEASYQCGWLVLNELSQETRKHGISRLSAKELYAEANLFEACSMKSVATLGAQERIPLRGVARPPGTDDLPVPSIMHLSQSHFLALLAWEGGMIRAYDPLWGDRLFEPEVLNAEASGRFLVPLGKVPSGWSLLGDDQLQTSLGRCVGGWGYLQKQEYYCEDCPCPIGGGGGGGPGGGVVRAVVVRAVVVQAVVLTGV